MITPQVPMVNSSCPQSLVSINNLMWYQNQGSEIKFLLFFLSQYFSGQAGVDFPVLASVPDTGFDCGIQEFPGIYGDTNADCQVRNKLI